MIVLLISSLVLVLGFSLDSSPSSSGGQGKNMVELNETSRLKTLDAIPEEDVDEEHNHDNVDPNLVERADDKDMLGDLARFPAELRVLIYQQYFFGDGISCEIRRSTKDIPRDSSGDREDNLTSKPCTVAHSTFIYGSDYVATYVERIWGPVWARLVGLEGLRELTVTVRPGWAGGWTVLGAARERCEDLLFGPVRRLESGGVVLRCEAC